MVRYPGWVSKGELEIRVNGKELEIHTLPSSYVGLYREWEEGDLLEICLPMHPTVEQIPNVPDYLAFIHGPILLAAKTGSEDLKGLIAGDGRWGQYAAGEYLPVDQAPILIDDDPVHLADKLVPFGDHPMHFRLDVKMLNPADLLLEPFYQIHDSRYMMYWLALTNDGYEAYVDSLAGIEKEKLELENRTIDFVASGEQQPETDHALQMENSGTGNHMNEFWRDARGGGYFSYDLATNSEIGTSLYVRYWGGEYGGRKFDIYIDDEKLVTEDNTARWNQSLFKEVIYPVPDTMLAGRSHVRVKFLAHPGNTAGAVYAVRLLRARADQ